MQTRIRPKDITKAVAELNRARGLTYPAIGYVMYADVCGSGIPMTRCYRINNADGGVSYAYDLQGATLRKTLANIVGETERYLPAKA